MTYKYQYIRREMYEKDPAGKLNSYRSLAEMRQLFKLPYWIMIGVLLISLISLLVFVLFYSDSPFIWIPVVIIILELVISQIPREKYMYNDSVRANELSEVNHNYAEYVSDVWNILQNCGINSPEKLIKLKTECETSLKIREVKFAKINSKLIDMLIGVPLGALIASIIYANNNAVPVAIGAIILIGLTILGIVKLIGTIQYYSEGYFKDKYLFDAINELDYYEKTLDENYQERENMKQGK